ncbi:MAG: VOC family protein [Pseudomonadota bacterium]
MALKHRGIHRLGYVRLALADQRLKRAEAFYCGQFGLLESRRGPGRLYLRCWHEPFAYSLVLEEAADNRLVEMGFQVRDEVDLARLAEAVERAGIAVQRSPAGAELEGLGASIAFGVPGGPRLRLYADQAQPGYVTGYDSPDWVTPRALRGTPAPFFLNHAGVTVADPAAAVDFLTGVLGFVVSECIEAADGRLLSALLFRMSKEVGGQELALFPGPAGALHHVAFTKEDPNDILVTGMYLREAGVDIDRYGPTRQSYGKTFSLHCRDPFGVRLELCAGGRVTEVHSEFQPVVWDEAELGKALSWYDRDLQAAFLEPSLVAD